MDCLYINSLIRNQYRLSLSINAVGLYAFCLRTHPEELSILVCNLRLPFNVSHLVKKRWYLPWSGGKNCQMYFCHLFWLTLSYLCPHFLGHFLPAILESCSFFYGSRYPLGKNAKQRHSPSLSAYHLPHPLGHRLIHVLDCADTFTLGCWNLCRHPSPPPISRPAREYLLRLLPASGEVKGLYQDKKPGKAAWWRML